MDVEIIKGKEASNDGQTVHLFYDEISGVYMAFGLSAYYTTMMGSPFLSFSDALKMPVALIDRGQIKYLR